MKKNKLLKLSQVLKEIKKRNLDPLLSYNSGRIVHKKQLEFHKSTKKNRWVFGGNRTGKTECGAVETIWISLGIHPFRKNLKSSQCWVVSLSTRVQKEVAQAKILKYLPKSAIVDVIMIDGKKSSPENGVIECIIVKNISGENSKIWFKSCEEGREKFQGTSLDFVWFDEEPPEDIYKECLMRVLDKNGEIFGTMTPLKGMTYIYDIIYLNTKSDPEVFCLFMSWDDNPFLSKKEIERLSSVLPSEELESRKFGRFLSYDSGLVYPEFDVNTHVIEPFEIPTDWQDMVSIDPGLTNPLSCHFYARDYDGNVYVVAEHFEANKTIEYHAEEIKKIAKRLNWKTASNGMIETLIDSAAKQRTLSSSKNVVDLFYENGIIANPNVNKDVLSGISNVKTYLKNISGKSKLFIFSNCTNLIREMKSYRWGGNEKPIKDDDHCLDELRYYIMSLNKPIKVGNGNFLYKNKLHLINKQRRQWLKNKKIKKDDLIKLLVNKASGFYYKEEQLEFEKTQKLSKNHENHYEKYKNLNFFENNVTVEHELNNSNDMMEVSNAKKSSEQAPENLTLSKKKVTTHYIPPDMLAIKMLFEIYGKKVGDKNIEEMSDEKLIKLKNKLLEEIKNEDFNDDKTN